MPILKYMLFAGCSLLALLLVAERTLPPAPSKLSNASTSLDVLRKMANHGGTRGFAPLADAGDMIPMPQVDQAHAIALAEPADAVKTTDTSKPPLVAQAESSATMNAQARVSEADIVDRPARRAKKIATKRPKHPHSVYVENVPRGPSGFFGAFQSW